MALNDLAELRRLVAAQGRRIAILERAQSVGEKVRCGGITGNAEKTRLAADRARRLAPLAESLGWCDSGRRLSDRCLLDLIREASPDSEDHIPSRATARRAVEAALGPSRAGSAWDAAGREKARRARAEIVRGNADFVSDGANGISRSA